jgi:3-hydroxyacyl-[acyl-carrier-protein] dehydratase
MTRVDLLSRRNDMALEARTSEPCAKACYLLLDAAVVGQVVRAHEDDPHDRVASLRARPPLLHHGVVRPEDFIPHRPPFLFIDQILDLVPAQSAVGRWHVDDNAFFLLGHPSGRLTVPRVLLVEAIAQLGGVALMADTRFAARLPLLGGIKSVTFGEEVHGGDSVDLTVEHARVGRLAGSGSGSASVQGRLVCRCDLTYVVVDR